ncbi:MAG TPA: glycosyltransferase [Candidatus Limnocylindria bacterium]|nr:glycosyltransferase [Candidatus Limnocylindria bacterium]
MYPLDQGMWGPTVRISHLRDELAARVDLDVVAGYRGARRLALASYAVSGRLRGLDGIYVESSTFLPAEADLAFLGLARALGIGVLTYIRDAYQLFADYGGAATLRQRASRAAFRPMVRGLRAVSSRLAFPTRGLADAVVGPDADALLLPPGAPTPVDVPRHDDADRLLFVGDARLPGQGADRLMAAVARARQDGVKVELEVISRPGQQPPAPHPEWLHVRHAEGEEIHALLPAVLATAIPRPRGAYNDLALPIKLFDYLSYGRPLLVTDCLEQARVVREADAGIVSADSPEALAAAIGRLASASAAELDGWSANAHAAARAASWSARAATIRDLLVPT